MSDWAGIFWLVILLLGNAFFVAAEFAVMSARRSQIEPLADAGNKRAVRALRAMESVSLMLAVCQLGITVCSLLILNVAEPAIHHLLVVPLEWVGLPEALAGSVAFIIALLIVTFLHVTFGEMVPKNISVSMADKAVLILAGPLLMLSTLVHPVVVSLNAIANGFLRLLKVEPKNEVNSAFTAEEVQSIIASSAKSGAMQEEDALRLSKALEFSNLTAEGTMVARERVVSLELGATVEQFERTVGRTGFSRIVISDGEDFVGYWHLKDVMSLPDAQYREPIANTPLRTMGVVAPDAEIEDALEQMRAAGEHLARVVDPSGSTLGVLFLEDVLEQLVGEIDDQNQKRGIRRENRSAQ
ncbi:hemolysin family protein [Paeniglutamicibacter sp. R2-26]|uniref:hemolysin family protein n=1 Tax=Paeniglutamicibacter sp. R2-26 TaxID=3144417 RepID=UPI003EE77225